MIRVEQAHLIVAARTHAGMSGKNNEDRYAVSAYRLSQERPVPALLALVADGVGGNRAGEVAAEMAVELISQHLAAGEAQQPVEMLEAAFQAANLAIYSQAQLDPSLSGMGTTCVCAWVIGDRLYAAWVGDSRLYLVRNNTIQRLSIDHTFVQEAVDKGVITPEEARTSPARHVIHRYLGMSKPVELDFRLRLEHGEEDQQAQANQGMVLLPGDILLLCSDGLTDLVQDAEILPVLLEASIEQVTTPTVLGGVTTPTVLGGTLDNLVDLANQRGGFDNITVVGLASQVTTPAPAVLKTTPTLIQSPQLPTLPSGGGAASPTGRRKAVVRGCLGAALLLVAVLLILFTGLWGINRVQSTPTLPSGATASPITAEPSESAALTQSPVGTPVQTATPAGPNQATSLATNSVLPGSATPQSATATLTPWP